MTSIEGPVRVMLVDDHNLVRAAVGDTLARHGIEVTGHVVTAEEALALLHSAEPDIVLVDIDLPGMNGIVLVGGLVLRHPACPVLTLTGSVDEANLPAAVRTGVAGYLTKDLSPMPWGERCMGPWMVICPCRGRWQRGSSGISPRARAGAGRRGGTLLRACRRGRRRCSTS